MKWLLLTLMRNILTGKNPDIKKINPIVFTMPDNNYFKIGEKVGDAWSDGKKFDLDQ